MPADGIRELFVLVPVEKFIRHAEIYFSG